MIVLYTKTRVQIDAGCSLEEKERKSRDCEREEV
jgi:hypothetical protein